MGDFERLARHQKQSGEMSMYHNATTGLILQDVQIGKSTVLCDISTGTPRPILPTSWTKLVFHNFHSLSHAGPRPSQEAITERFVCHGMKRDIRKWCKECHACHSSKFHRHTQGPLQQSLTDSHFNDRTESSSAETNTSHWMSVVRNSIFIDPLKVAYVTQCMNKNS